jgi:hypothetical protein
MGSSVVAIVNVPFHSPQLLTALGWVLDIRLFCFALIILASFRQQLFDRIQFETMLLGGCWIRHLEFPQRIKNDLGDDQPRVLLIVGGNDVPRRMMRACRAEGTLRMPSCSDSSISARECLRC